MNMLIQLAEHNPSLAKPGEAWDGSWSGNYQSAIRFYKNNNNAKLHVFLTNLTDGCVSGFQGYPPRGATEDFRIKGLSGVNLLTKQENLSLAQRVFCDLLGGEMHQPSTFPQLVPSRFYVFTWPDSPLNIAINIEVSRLKHIKILFCIVRVGVKVGKY